MSTRANEPAFPFPSVPAANGEMIYGANGMTLREHFAGLAMQGLIGLLANPGIASNPAAFAQDAVRYADALIAELAKPAMRPHRHTAECDGDCMITEERAP